jgi:hypothetical protein
LRFAGRFSQNAGRANPIFCKSSNGFNNLEEVLATTRSRERLRVLQGRFWEIAGRSSVKLRILAGLAQIPLRVDMVYWPTPSAPRDGRHDQRGNFQTALRNRVSTPRQRRTSLFFHQAQRQMPSLWLGWWWRGEDDSGFEQKFAYLLPYKIAHPGGGDIPCEQLDGMRPRPFSLLVGALTAGPTAEGWRPAAGTDLEPLFADRAPGSFAPPRFWPSGCHPRRPFDGFRQTLRQ